MKVLYEENITDWGNIVEVDMYKNVMPLLFMPHAIKKFDTHVTMLSNQYLLDTTNTDYVNTIVNIISYFSGDRRIVGSMKNALTTQNPDWKQNFNLNVIRPFRTQKGIATLFYSLLVIMTTPFIDDKRKPKDMSNDEWVDEIVRLRHNLSDYKNITQYADRPVFLVKAFTGGFKNDFKPYASNNDRYNTIGIIKKLDEIDIRNDSKLLNQLIQYQRQCI